MVSLKFLIWNNQIDAVEAVKIESSLYPLPSPVILNPVYALMSRTKGVWSLKTAFSVDTHDENMISLNSETKHFNPKKILHFEVDQTMLISCYCPLVFCIYKVTDGDESVVVQIPLL